MSLSLVKVARFYGSRLIFKDVSVDLAPGSIMLLAGANGSGKSTLLKIMAGLSQPSSGTVHFHKIKNGDEKKHPLIGFLGHQTFIYPGLTAAENLHFWARLYGCHASEGEVESALERVELKAFLHEKAGVFSRGMAQRLSLARLLLLRPDILLLDEPGTGLDTRSLLLLRQEITNWASAGSAVVWVSHTLADDLHLAHRVAYFEKRRLCLFDSPHDFLSAQNTQDGTLREVSC